MVYPRKSKDPSDAARESQVQLNRCMSSKFVDDIATKAVSRQFRWTGEGRT
jgi:hypothetical protein